MKNKIFTALATVMLFGMFQCVDADTGISGVNTLHGMRIYNKACASCHQDGRHGAPKLDDISSWKKRLFLGEEVLDHHALAGHIKNPKIKGHSEYSEQDIIDAVHFMVVMLRDAPAN